MSLASGNKICVLTNSHFRDVLRKFAMDVNEDKRVDETVIQDLILTVGWEKILDPVRMKMDVAIALTRSQLLCLYTTLFTLHANLEGEGEQEEARQSLLSMLKMVVKSLGSTSINWTSLQKSEVEGVRVMINTIENIPAFVENIRSKASQ